MQDNIWFQSEVRAFLPRIERLLPHLPKDKRAQLESVTSGLSQQFMDNLAATLDKWEYLYMEDLDSLQ